MEDKICKRLDVISEDLRDINMKIDYIIDALGDGNVEEKIYSPAINEALIPILYHTAKDRGMPMTKLVDNLLVDSLYRQNIPPDAQVAFSEYLIDNNLLEYYTDKGIDR